MMLFIAFLTIIENVPPIPAWPVMTQYRPMKPVLTFGFIAFRIRIRKIEVLVLIRFYELTMFVPLGIRVGPAYRFLVLLVNWP